VLFANRDKIKKGGKRFPFLLIGVVLLFSGDCRKRLADDQIVARVGDVVLTKDAMKREIGWEGMRPEQENEFVDRWVNRELLFQEAKRLGLDKDAELNWQLELVKKEYLINKLLERTFAKKVKITDDEVKSYYEKHGDLFKVTEDEVRALHILTKTKAEADLALKEIRAGKPFSEVAKEHSIGIFRKKGGDMGFFKRRDVIPEVARFAFRLPEGKVSPVFHSSYGYHILKVLKRRRKGEIKDLSDVRKEIIQSLRVSKERSVYYDLLFQLQNKTKVYVIAPENSTGQRDTLTVRNKQKNFEESRK